MLELIYVMCHQRSSNSSSAARGKKSPPFTPVPRQQPIHKSIAFHYDSALAFDFTGLDPATFRDPTLSAPEPPPSAMRGLELGLVAVIVCRRQRSGPKRKSSPLIAS